MKKIFLFLILLFSMSLCNAEYYPWPEPGYNTENTCGSPYDSETDGTIKWLEPMQADDGNLMYIGGMYNDHLYVINSDSQFFIVDRDDGSVKCSVQTPGARPPYLYFTGPAVDSNGNAYFGSPSPDVFYSYDSSCNQRWATPVDSDPDMNYPLIYEGNVYISTAESIYALDCSDGSVVRNLGISTDTSSAMSSMAIKDDVLYAATLYDLDDPVWYYVSQVSAIDINDFSYLWNYTISKGQVGGSNLIAGGITVDESNNVYFASFDGDLHSLDNDGNLRWIFDNDYAYGISAYIDFTPIYKDGMVYYHGSDENDWSMLFGIYANNGTKKWGANYTIVTAFSSDSGWGAISNNSIIYIATQTGDISAIYANNGSEKWSWQDDNYGYLTTPILDEYGNLFVGIDNDSIIAFESTATPPAPTPTPTSTPIIAIPPIIIPTIIPIPEIVSEPPELTIIEEIIKFLLFPMNWLPILFAYLGALSAKIIVDRENKSFKDILADVTIYGTPGWILVLIVNLFINITSISELFSIAVFFSSGFIISLIMNLREIDSKK